MVGVGERDQLRSVVPFRRSSPSSASRTGSDCWRRSTTAVSPFFQDLDEGPQTRPRGPSGPRDTARSSGVRSSTPGHGTSSASRPRPRLDWGPPCAAIRPEPGELYSEHRDPIAVLPGAAGSKDGEVLRQPCSDLPHQSRFVRHRARSIGAERELQHHVPLPGDVLAEEGGIPDFRGIGTAPTKGGEVTHRGPDNGKRSNGGFGAVNIFLTSRASGGLWAEETPHRS